MEKYAIYGIGLAAVIFYSSLSPLLKKVNQDVPSFLVIAISMLFLSLFAFGLHFINEKPMIPSWNSLGILLLVGLLNVIGFYLLLQAIEGMPIWHYQMIAVITPILGAISAYYILGEHFSYKLFIGLAIAAFGIYLAVKPS